MVSLALAAVYFSVSHVALKLAAIGGVAAPIWPSTGIALAALLIFGRRHWPGVFLGAFAANYLATKSIPVAATIATGNTLEAVIGSMLLIRAGFDGSMRRLMDVALLASLAAILSTLVSATIGVGVSWLWGLVPSSQFALAWKTWWTGDVLSDIIVAPLLLTWRASPKIDVRDRGRVIEATALFLFLAASAAYRFSGGLAPRGSFLKAYMFFPFLLWALLRFGQRASITGVFLLTMIATVGTAFGGGPFLGGSTFESFASLQSFVGVLAMTFLFCGALVAERDTAEELMKSAMRDREDLLSIVSHDLRNPLISISLNSQLIANSVPASTEGKRILDRATRILRSTDQMRNLIDRTLEVGKLESGTVSLKRRSEDASVLIGEAVDGMRSLAEEKSIELLSELGEKNYLLQCDHERILQVLSNLLGNAIKFTPSKGRVIVSLDKTGAENAPEFVVLSVKDTGPGIPPEKLSRLFDRYWQGAHNGKAGVGLGLSIAKAIVEAHGGSLWAESHEGSGAVFRFTLPIQG